MRKDRTRSRVKWLTGVAICVLVALTVRIGYISLIEGRTYGYMASGARLKRIVLPANRGNILDRNNIPMTGTEISSSKIYLSRNGTRQILTFQSLKSKRQSSVAQHLVGYLDAKSQKGITGLQRVYDDRLKNTNPPTLEYSQSATGETILDFPEIIENNNHTKDVKTTIDINIQRLCEQVFQNSGYKKGAIVVEDVKTSEIMALTSFPNYSVDKLEEELKNESQPFINRALSQYNVGSIFKIVDVLAYLDKFGVKDVKYKCVGEIDVNGYKLSCSNHTKHGEIGLTEAFANSCNTYFVNLALSNKLDVVEFARKIGILNSSQFTKIGINESTGSLPEKDEIFNDGDMANAVLGQGDVRLTPLQICTLCSMIANGGVYNQAYVSYEDTGGLIKNQPIISKQYANVLKEYMHSVTVDGTGKYANLEDEFSKNFKVAGKTGTAEVEGNTSHAWFAGFFPYDNPKYSITVFVENGGYGGSVAGQMFSEICTLMVKQGLI